MIKLDPSTKSNEIETALAEILKLLDLTRDIERNRDDNDFVRSGGSIKYVFDENVFELFVDPWAWKGHTSTFYSPFWHKRANTVAVGSWSSIAAQSALLASEYLFSMNLPGQLEGKIYVTEWHMWELKHRLRSLFEECRSRVSAREATPNLSLEISVSKQPFLQEDLQHLQQHDFAWTSEAIDRFVVTRTAAHALATDRAFEPLEQIDRIVSGPLGHAIFSLPQPEVGAIDASTELWVKRLTDEYELRVRMSNSHEGARKLPRRPRASLRTDAHALAYIQWEARRVDRSKIRMVMVTGDEIVFNAYRRWYSQLGQDDPDFYQPFVLRRLVQYAPIFNLNDAEGDVSQANDLFDQTRAAVEVALLPFNLSQIGVAAERQQHVTRGREFLALRRFSVSKLSEDHSIMKFASSLTQEWLSASRAKLDELSALWQRTERMAIGSMYNGILPRLTSEQARIASIRAESGAATLRPGLTEYMQDLLGRIVENSVKLWYPLAIDFIVQNSKTADEADARRIRPPINLRFRHQRKSLPENLGDLLRQDSKREPSIHTKLRIAKEEFEDQPALLFALAATVALSLGAWSYAERFGDLAKQSAIPFGRILSKVDGDGYEYLYLHALTMRFRLGEFAPVRSDVGLRTLRRMRNEAADMLTLCERAPPLVNDLPQLTLFKRLRALSERAALNGFYGAALRIHRRGTREVTGTQIAEAQKALDHVEKDLRSCLGLAGDVLTTLTAQNFRELIAPIRRQYLSNIAALVTMRAVFSEPLGSRFVNDLSLVGELRNLLEGDSALPDLVRLEIEVFLVLSGSRPPGSISTDWAKRKLSLSLDAALLTTIVEALPRILSEQTANPENETIPPASPAGS